MVGITTHTYLPYVLHFNLQFLSFTGFFYAYTTRDVLVISRFHQYIARYLHEAVALLHANIAAVYCNIVSGIYLTDTGQTGIIVGYLCTCIIIYVIYIYLSYNLVFIFYDSYRIRLDDFYVIHNKDPFPLKRIYIPTLHTKT